jgi:putative pyrroloquinoline-quinone binding quinoprotein
VRKMIDLGEMPREQTPVEAVAPLPVRALLSVLALLLIPLLAASAHSGPPRPPVVVPAHLGDTTYVDGDLLFVIGAGPDLLASEVRNQVISAYALPGAKLLSRTTVAVSGRIYAVHQVGTTIVVAYQIEANGNQAVVGLTAGTGTALWRRAAGLVAVSAADRLVLLTSPQAEIGVNLVDGTDRWSVPHPIDAGVTEAGWVDDYPRWFVTAGAGRLATHDARTGAVTAAITVAKDGLADPVGDLLVFDLGPAGLTAYHLPDLTRRWHSDVDLSQSWTRTPCGPVICAFQPQRGMIVLDPATGRRLWTAERWAFAEPVGPYLIATVLDRERDDPQQWILDAATGRVLGDFGSWQALALGPSPGLLYGKRELAGKYVVWYGVLDPRTRRSSILGSAERVSGDCEFTPDAFICRLVDASVAVWELG